MYLQADLLYYNILSYLNIKYILEYSLWNWYTWRCEAFFYLDALFFKVISLHKNIIFQLLQNLEGNIEKKGAVK